MGQWRNLEAEKWDFSCVSAGDYRVPLAFYTRKGKSPGCLEFFFSTEIQIPAGPFFKMNQELKKSLRKIKFKVLPQTFLIIRIPLNYSNEIFNNVKKIKNVYSIILEKEGVTLIISENNWNKIKSKFNKSKIEKGYKIITYGASTDLNLVGFLSFVSKILADKNISVNVLSAFTRDYFLIKKSKVKLAVKELNKFTNKPLKNQ